MKLSKLILPTTLLGFTVAASAFPGWLKSPKRTNPLDPKSAAWKAPTPPVFHNFHALISNFGSVHLGESAGFRVVDQASGLEVANQYFPFPPINTCNMSVAFPSIARQGRSFNVEVMAEYGAMDGVLDPADHNYRVPVNMVGSAVETVVDHGFPQIPFAGFASFNVSTRLPSPVQGYDLKVTLANFSPHVGQTVVFRLRDISSGELRAYFKINSLQFPCHEIYIFTGLVPGQSYDFDIFADLNSNGLYDGLGIDHSWRYVTGTVSANLAVTVDHSLPQTDVGPISIP